MPSAATRSEILKLAAGMFGASLNAGYYNQFAAYVEGGMSIRELAQVLAGTGVFQSLYPTSLSNREFANSFVADILGLGSSYNFDAADASADFLWARNWAEARLGTADRGTLVYEAVFGLDATTAGGFQAARARLENRTTVADYYVARGGSEGTLSGLQSVVSAVTADPATVTSAEAAVDLTVSSTSASSTVYPGRFDVSGTISSTAPSGTASVTLTAGHTYVVQATYGPNSQLDPEITAVLGPDGQAVSGWTSTNYGFSRNAQLTINPTVSGTYVVQVGGEGGTTGAYTASLRDVTDTGGSAQSVVAATGTTTRAMIDVPRTHQEFSVALAAGQTVDITASSLTSVANPLLRPTISEVLNPEGNPVSSASASAASDYGSATLTLTASTTGTYKIVVGDATDDLGAFQFQVSTTRALLAGEVRTDDYAASTATTASVTSGSTTTGSIEANGDQDWVAAYLYAGYTYTFGLRGADSTGGTLADPVIDSIRNSAGTSLGYYDDDGGTGFDSLVNFAPTTTGTYYLVARSINNTGTGTYTVTLAGGPSSTATDDYAATTATTGAVSSGGSATGAIEAGADQDWFAAYLYAGYTYTFNVRGADSAGGTLIDPYIGGIYNSSGTFISGTSDDDSGTGYDAMMSYVPTTSGTYYVAAAGYGTRIGTYTVSLTGGPSGTPTDDYAGSSATTGTITSVASVSGTINTSGDTDWFAMDVTAGVAYRFDLQGHDSNNGTLADPLINGIYNSSGSLVSGSYDDDSGTGYDSQLSFTPTTSGRYYIEARGYGSSTGTYTLSMAGGSTTSTGTTTTITSDLPASSSTTATLTAGNAIVSSVGTSGDRDWIALSLTAGNRYQIDVQGRDSSNGTLADPVINGIYNSSAQAVANTYDDDSGTGYDALLTYTPTTTATYYVEVRGYGSNTGTYTLRLTNTASGSIPVVTASDLPATSATTGAVSVGSSYASSIETAADRDWIAMTLVGGTLYRIDLQGAGSGSGTLSDPLIYGVYTSAGSLVSGTYNDDGGSNLESRLDFTPSASGTYYLETRGYGSATGSYTVRLSASADDAPASTATGLSVTAGSTATGNIEASGDVDWIRATLTAGTQYAIGMRGASTSGGTLSYPNIYGLYDASGNYVYSGVIYSSGTGSDDLLYFTPTATGSYYIAASSTYGTGTYTVTLTGLVDDAPASTSTTLAVTLGGSVTGNIERSGDVDWIRASLTAGTRYQVDMEGSATSGGTLTYPEIYGVYDASGSYVYSGVTDSSGSGSNDRVYFTPTASGNYYFAASALSGIGTYTVRLSGITDDAPASTSTTLSVSVGASATGRIESSGDRDWIGMDLTAGVRYQVDLRGVDSGGGTLPDPYLGSIYNASGIAITSTYDDDSGSGYDSRAFYTPTTSGRYYVEASGYGTSTGTYTVGVTALTTTTAPGTTVTTDLPANTTTTGTLEAGASMTSRVETAGDVDWIRVALTSGRQYQFGLEGAPTSQGTLTDPYLSGIYDASGSLYAGTADDDSGAGYNALVTFTAPATGNYFVAARGYGNATGTYTLSLTDQGAIPGGTTSGGSIGTTTGSSGATNNWTVMVYVDGDNNLEPYAIRDLNEMEAANLPTGVNVVTLVDRTSGYDTSNGNWTDAREGVIARDYNSSVLSSSLTSIGEVNMGNAATLTSFINWAAQTRPAQNYALVLWDHGGGLRGVAADDTSNGDILSLSEVRQAIANSTIGRVGVVGFDACLMGMVEIAYELNGLASYVVASEELEPGDGWNYTNWLGNSFAGGANASAATLANTAVSTYGSAYQNQRDVTLSAISIDRMPSLVSALQAFTVAAQGATSSDWTAIDASMQQATDFTYASSVDLRGFASSLAGRSGVSSSIASAANGLAAAVTSTVTAATSNMSGTNGLAIYWPESRPYDFGSSYTQSSVSLLGTVAWNSFLESFWAHT